MALELLERKIDLTAIIAYSDLVALGISRAVREAGLRIPGDISLVGWDNINITQYIDPPLTTVHSPVDAMAAALRSCLCGQIAGGQVEMLTRLATRLIIRQSSGISPSFRPMAKSMGDF